MKIETSNKSVNIVLKTRTIIELTNSLNSKSFEEGFFTAQRNCGLKELSKIIYTLGENEEGKKAFNSIDEVYDFIDDYKKEEGKSYKDIYTELAEAINEEGFFNMKMTKKDLSAKLNNPVSDINLENIMNKAVENVVTDVAKEEFQGYKG